MVVTATMSQEILTVTKKKNARVNVQTNKTLGGITKLDFILRVLTSYVY